MEWIIVIAIVAVVAAVMAMKKSGGRNDNMRVVTSVKVASEVSEEPSSVIHYSNEYIVKESAQPRDSSHDVKTILTMNKNVSLWICSYCETENRSSDSYCCVCANRR